MAGAAIARNSAQKPLVSEKAEKYDNERFRASYQTVNASMGQASMILLWVVCGQAAATGDMHHETMKAFAMKYEVRRVRWPVLQVKLS